MRRLGQRQQPQRLRRRRRPRLARRQHRQPQPAAQRKQHLDQLIRADRIRPGLRGLQHQLTARAVTRQVQHIPTGTVIDRLRQPSPGHPVLQHPQLHRPRPRHPPHQLPQRVPLPAQPQHTAALRQAEHRQQPHRAPLTLPTSGARRPASRRHLVHQTDLLPGQHHPAQAGDLQRPIRQKPQHRRHHHPHTGRRLRQQLLHDLGAQQVLPDPGADPSGQSRLRAQPVVRIRLPAQKPVQVLKRSELVGRRVQINLMRRQRLAVLGLQQPPPPRRPRNLQRLQHQPRHPTPPPPHHVAPATAIHPQNPPSRQPYNGLLVAAGRTRPASRHRRDGGGEATGEWLRASTRKSPRRAA